MRTGCSRAEDLVQVAVNDALDDRAVGPAFLCQRHEQRTGAGGHDRVRPPARDRRLVGATPYRALGGQHGNAPGARGLAGGRGTRFDDALHRHRVELRRQRLQRDGRGRIAGYDQALHATPLQLARGLQRILADRARTLGAVRQARRVAEIDEVLAGQPLDQCAQHGQAADARVENADRRRCGFLDTEGFGWHCCEAGR